MAETRSIGVVPGAVIRSDSPVLTEDDKKKLFEAEKAAQDANHPLPESSRPMKQRFDGAAALVVILERPGEIGVPLSGGVFNPSLILAYCRQPTTTCEPGDSRVRKIILSSAALLAFGLASPGASFAADLPSIKEAPVPVEAAAPNG